MAVFRVVDYDDDNEEWYFCTEACAESFAGNHNFPEDDISQVDPADIQDIIDDDGKCAFCKCVLKEPTP